VRPTRRVVTGHDEHGRSVVLADGVAPKTHVLPSATFHELWNTAAAPAPLEAVEPREPTDRPLMTPPDERGTVIRIVDLEPHSRSPTHRTETIDYGIVLTGAVTLALDDGSETRLDAGDVVIQRGTAHAWLNEGDEHARMVFVLVDARFAPELEALLPAGRELFDRVLDV
jgi:quercetin dioxygenase-like cupin family protein